MSLVLSDEVVVRGRVEKGSFVIGESLLQRKFEVLSTTVFIHKVSMRGQIVSRARGPEGS